MLEQPKGLIQKQEQQLYNLKINSANTLTAYNSQSRSDFHKNQTKKNLSGANKYTQQSQNHTDIEESDGPKIQSQQTSQIHQDESSQDIDYYEIPKSQKPRSRYGSMLIFCESKYFLLSLGPNYIFFLIAYICFTLATIYLVGLVNSNMDSIHFKIFNFCFCWLQNLSYLMVALSNPGIQLPQSQLLLRPNQVKNKRFCLKCGAVQQRKTYHCRQCDVCVRDYDHHCPWTSKCIGQGNLYRFYLFVCTTPFYIFYYMVVFMICMANTVVAHEQNLRKMI